MQNYIPNFLDQRTRQRIEQIVKWAEQHIGAETKILHSKILRSPAAFGNSPLGIYLKNNLLVKTCPAFKPGEFSQQYRLNIDYLNKLRSELGLPLSPLRHNRIDRRFQAQAAEIASGDFEYTESGGRWYNGLQNIPRSLKEEYWSEQGYLYDYDIDTCAPTLLLQQAQKLKPSMKSLDFINFYISNKNLVRDELMIKYNLSSSQVKQIINGLFQGGILNTYKENKIFGYLHNNRSKMKDLADNEFLIALIKDIKYLWGVLRGQITTGYTYRGDQRRSNKITGKHKSDYYKILEGQVMKVVWRSLRKKNIKFFREHDGFRSDQFVIPDELEQMILFETGFHVKFKWTKIESTENNV